MTDFKKLGNDAFQAKNFEEAVTHFSKGIEADPTNHVLFSNRSAAQASLENFEEALKDAEKTVELKPDWPKGYSRLGVAASGLGQHAKAFEAYERGLKVDPSSTLLQEGLEQARAVEKEDKNRQSSLFGPQFMARLATDPVTRAYLHQPDFLQMIHACGSNPQLLNMYLKDPRFSKALEVGLGIRMATDDDVGGPMEEDAPAAAAAAAAAPPTPAQATSAPASAPAAAPRGAQGPAAGAAASAAAPKDAEMKEADAGAAAAREGEAAPGAGAKAQAQEEKARGNAAYKARRFEDALAHYDNALGLDDTDISFLSNKAAVHFEMGDYEACMKDCDHAVARGRELRSDYKLVAKAMTRKGNALAKLERLEEAIGVYQKSLTEHRSADTLARLQEAERRLKEGQQKAYIDLALAEQEREAGNEAFKGQDYPKAVAHYSEALKRGPGGVNPEAHKLFSNRAACYTKLGAWAEGLKDADECIALAPAFPKGYSRKGHLQFFMKEYEKALETYEAGLKQDPGNAELKDGVARCTEAMTKLMRGDASEEELAQRRERALADKDIQSILQDPVVRQVLQDIQEDPRSGQQHLKNPAMAQKIMKLVNAGIVQMK